MSPSNENSTDENVRNTTENGTVSGNGTSSNNSVMEELGNASSITSQLPSNRTSTEVSNNTTISTPFAVAASAAEGRMITSNTKRLRENMDNGTNERKKVQTLPSMDNDVTSTNEVSTLTTETVVVDVSSTTPNICKHQIETIDDPTMADTKKDWWSHEEEMMSMKKRKIMDCHNESMGHHHNCTTTSGTTPTTKMIVIDIATTTTCTGTNDNHTPPPPLRHTPVLQERTLAPSVHEYLMQGRSRHRGGTSGHTTTDLTTTDIPPRQSFLKYLPRPEWCDMPQTIMVSNMMHWQQEQHFNLRTRTVEHDAYNPHLQRCIPFNDVVKRNDKDISDHPNKDDDTDEDIDPEHIAYVNRQLRSNVMYYDIPNDLWNTKSIDTIRTVRTTTCGSTTSEDVRKEETSSSSVEHSTKNQMTFEDIIIQQHLTKHTFGKDEDSILHKAIKENATMAALDLIRIEYNTCLDFVRRKRLCNHHPLLDRTLLGHRNSKGVTPLIIAAQKGNLPIVQALVKCGISLMETSNNGSTAILQAAHFGHVKVIEYILNYYMSHHERMRLTAIAPHPWPETLVELSDQPNSNETTPLMRAAQEGHVSTAKVLLKYMASVDRRNSAQMTPLMLAAQRGHALMCRFLIRNGADLNAKTNHSSTALLLACKRGHVSVVQELISAGCELHHTDDRNRTAQQIMQRRIRRHQERPILPVPVVPNPPRNRRNHRHRRNQHNNNENRGNNVAPVDGNDDRDESGDDDGENGNIHGTSLQNDERILRMLNPQAQLELMRSSLRMQRHFEMIRLYTLFQRSRAYLHFPPYDRAYDIASALPCLTESVVPTEREDHIPASNTTQSQHPPPRPPQKSLPSWFRSVNPSVQMLMRSMILPAPLIQSIAMFLPLPTLWQVRIKRLRSWTCENNPNEAVVHLLDIIDEILEAAGLLTALDAAQIAAPFPHSTWHEWKQSAISNTTLEIKGGNTSQYSPSWYITESEPLSLQDEKNPSMCELRRRAGYLPLLSKNECGTNIVSILMHEPYCIPREIMQPLIHIADVASLCRRSCIESNPSTTLDVEPHNDAVISHVVNFEPVVATDILYVTTQFCAWQLGREAGLE